MPASEVLDVLTLRHEMRMESERLRACTDYVMARVAHGAQITLEDAILHLQPREVAEAVRERRREGEAALRQMKELQLMQRFNEAYHDDTARG